MENDKTPAEIRAVLEQAEQAAFSTSGMSATTGRLSRPSIVRPKTVFTRRSVREVARAFWRKEVNPFLELIDKKLVLVSVDGDTEGSISLMEEIALKVMQIEFIEYGGYRRGGTKRGHSKVKSVDPTRMKIAEIEIDGISLSDFFTRDCSIEEIFAILHARSGEMQRYSQVILGIVPSLLSLPTENLEIEEQKLDRARYLFRNVMRFRNWLYESLATGDITEFCAVVPAFAEPETMRLGGSIGRWFHEDYSPVLIQLREAMRDPSNQSSADKFQNIYIFARDAVFKSIEGFEPLDNIVRETSPLEIETRREAVDTAFDRLSAEFQNSFSNIYELLVNIDGVDVLAGSSLYLQRLGVERFDFNITAGEEDKALLGILYAKDGTFLMIKIPVLEDKQDTDAWIGRVCEMNGLSDTRAKEILIYFQSFLIDLERASRNGAKISKGTRIRDSVSISQRLLEEVGLRNSYSVRTDYRRYLGDAFIRENPTGELVKGGRIVFDYSDRVDADWIDPETAEVIQSTVYAIASRYSLSWTGDNKTGSALQAFRNRIAQSGGMHFDFDLFQRAENHFESVAEVALTIQELSTIHLLDPQRDWFELFERLGRHSTLASVELALLNVI